MKEYACNKCGSTDVFIDDRGNQKALMCGDCSAWLKWIGKKELPLVERYIKNNNQDIEFAAKPNTTECNVISAGGQIRVWNYKTNKIDYFDVSESSMRIVLDILNDEAK